MESSGLLAEVPERVEHRGGENPLPALHRAQVLAAAFPGLDQRQVPALGLGPFRPEPVDLSGPFGEVHPGLGPDVRAAVSDLL